jgi:GH25 family lysozyme M1 (1,4-beta-N-acetylmuramidase)
MTGVPVGIDVSRHQGQIDWRAVKSAGVVLAVAKATEGTRSVDVEFTANRVGMRVAGIKYRGFYHFADMFQDPIDQAQHLLRTVGPLQRGEFIVLDIESKTLGSKAANQLWVRSFLANAAKAVGDRRRVWVYTGPSYWQSGFDFDPGHPLWIAHYTAAPRPWIPTKFTEAIVWQYSSSETVPGIGGRVDANRILAPSLDPFTGTTAVAPVPKPDVIPAPSPYPGKPFGWGAVGGHVRTVQRALRVPVTGVYDRATRNAVFRYQGTHPWALAQDRVKPGAVGSHTYSSILTRYPR